MPDPRQHELDKTVTQLEDFDEGVPEIEGVPSVLVTSVSNSRGCYHKQHPRFEGRPACGQQLKSERAEWKWKPIEAMRRASTTPCSDPDCFGEQ